MVVNGYEELNKITLVGWVDNAIDQSLTKDNIRLRFMNTDIWLLNPRVMDKRT